MNQRNISIRVSEDIYKWVKDNSINFSDYVRKKVKEDMKNGHV